MTTEGSQPTRGRSRRAERRERLRTWSLQNTCRTIGGMYLALAPGHLVALSGAPAAIMSTLAAASAAGLFVLGEVVSRRRRAGAVSLGDDPVAFGIATLVLANSLTHLAVRGEAQDSINLLLLIVGASYFIRSARWLLPFIGLTLVGWSSAVALFVEDFDWLHYAFATFFALGLATVLYRSRQAYLDSQAHARESQRIQSERIHAALREAESELEQRQRILGRLEAAEARSAAVTEVSPDAVILVDHHDRITVANPTAVEIFGYAREDLVGRTLAETIVPERLRESHLIGISRYLESREPHVIGRRLRLPARRADGTEFPAELTLREVRVSDSPPLFVGFIADLTERESVEEALREARDRAEEASRAKSQFLARMSHEIRTPLNAVVGLTNLAIAELPQGRLRDLLERSRGAGEYLSAVLGDTLDLSKIEAGCLEVEQRPISPRHLLEDACDFLAIRAADRGLDLILQVDVNVPDRLVGDSTRIRQIVTNLVGNAIKFTHRGWVRVSMHARDDRLHIEVEDTGVGVPPILKRRIFEEFEQGQPGADDTQAGTGLGLTISRRLAHLLGGVITLEDRAGGGSRFSLVLPCVAAGSRLPTIPKPTVGRVLLALSQPVERAAIRENLSQWSLVVEEACDPVHLRDLIDEASSEAPRLETTVLFDPETFPLSACPNPEFEWIAVVRSSATPPPSFSRGVLTRPVGPRALTRLLSRAAVPDDTEIAAPWVPTSGRPILVAEDNEINQIVLAEILRREGRVVDVANDGYEAVDVLERQSFDAVLMDISMPGMDGFETLERIRSLPNGQAAPVVAVSAYATQEMRDRVLAAGFDGFLPKPVQSDEIRRILSELPAGEVGTTEDPRSRAAAGTDQGAEVLDVETLERLTEGDRALIRRLSRIFEESYPELLRSIDAAIASRSWDELRRPLHKLKGTLGDIGGSAAFEIASALSKAGREHDHAAAELAFARLEKSLRATSERLAGIAAEVDEV